jgi:hypothetical protein
MFFLFKVKRYGGRPQVKKLPGSGFIGPNQNVKHTRLSVPVWGGIKIYYDDGGIKY